MPIFDYRCSACGFEIEVMQKVGEAALTECPECHAATFQKCLSAPRFRLSGSGWYETDEKPKNLQRNIKNKDGESSAGA